MITSNSRRFKLKFYGEEWTFNKKQLRVRLTTHYANNVCVEEKKYVTQICICFDNLDIHC